MHIITRKRILDFSKEYPACKVSLESWYRIVKHTSIGNFNELRRIFPSADLVGKFTVFNIGGNKARLITAIHYNTLKVYIRKVLTHAEYDKNRWKKG